jgi:hypothetical protein
LCVASSVFGVGQLTDIPGSVGHEMGQEVLGYIAAFSDGDADFGSAVMGIGTQLLNWDFGRSKDCDPDRQGQIGI